jgi:NADPH:quinone reductase-like Zn-dependent oxidoreductase
LIHSGAGGVGIAAVQLAQYLQAEVCSGFNLIPPSFTNTKPQIYVTVGSDEKRSFLQEHLNIPASRIFSSRTTEFADAIIASTKGRGVDVILNSLTGELLDETWRICADGGILVDIGRGLRGRRLAPGPFERNCLVKAFDLTSKQVSDDIVRRFVALSGHLKYSRKILTLLI